MADSSLKKRRDRLFGAGAPLFYTRPLEIVRGEGAFLFDADGRRYVDLYNNVPCVGHANVHVVEAMARAQSTLNVHSRYLHRGILDFAERYLELHPDEIENVVFSCSGTEAVEVAIQMARAATGRGGILCCAHAYHGNSTLVSQLTDVDPENPRSEEVRSFPVPDPFRFSSSRVDSSAGSPAGEFFLERALSAVRALARSETGIAAMLVCPILANEGTPAVPAGFLSELTSHVRQAGGLIICDEVQAGYCRTGSWWGYQVAGISPDIVVTGKPMGNGLPLAATAASGELTRTFRQQSHYFNTCSSSPLQAAAGLAVLEEIHRLRVQENVQRVGQLLKSELNARLGRWPTLGEIRGHGLFINIEIVVGKSSRAPNAAFAGRIVDALVDEGFLTGTNGPHSNQVKIRPPLVLGEQEARDFVSAFDRVMDRLDG
jgi:4-aminobutyrate aminotransferase-like enzyme